jgi:hypothetical protein
MWVDHLDLERAGLELCLQLAGRQLGCHAQICADAPVNLTAMYIRVQAAEM